ncbi:MAG TPA: PhzF family phenazine biosynthesis protein [Lacibacter sp.]|nr:PhzF family phenazine biosynthesis protein [Lacibacter sp.]HMO89140.1 PhzF family phenazine biosynthesis protein [Lacibacter sp.]HMP87844.1 PhzF family phenazine biosynthesis protein [Lacibacter sp.]
MKLELYQVDAFADRLFTGNPAAVIPLQEWPVTALLQNLALENNLSETVFIVPLQHPEADFEIRWFTPGVEVNLCGHATLAAAWVLFERLSFAKPTVVFRSKSGLLRVTKRDTLLELDFPSWKPDRLQEYPEGLERMLGIREIVGVYQHRDLLVEVASEAEVAEAHPDFAALRQAGAMVILTARGREVDFVSRFFAPGAGVDEDPVTGSAHSQLIPFWADKLGKRELSARQLSQRGGTLYCTALNEERVLISGRCVFYMKGEIEL